MPVWSILQSSSSDMRPSDIATAATSPIPHTSECGGGRKLTIRSSLGRSPQALSAKGLKVHEPDGKGPAPERELGILARRKIEAAAIKPIYEEMRAAFGEARAREILRKAIRRAALATGAEMAKLAPGGASLESFKKILPLWSMDDALKIEILADEPGVLDFNVTRCRYAETYRAMGLAEIGDILSCERDGAYCEGYAADIELARTQTIMRGASHCDFRYRAAAGKEPDASKSGE